MSCCFSIWAWWSVAAKAAIGDLSHRHCLDLPCCDTTSLLSTANDANKSHGAGLVHRLVLADTNTSVSDRMGGIFWHWYQYRNNSRKQNKLWSATALMKVHVLFPQEDNRVAGRPQRWLLHQRKATKLLRAYCEIEKRHLAQLVTYIHTDTNSFVITFESRVVHVVNACSWTLVDTGIFSKTNYES